MDRLDATEMFKAYTQFSPHYAAVIECYEKVRSSETV